MERVLLLIGKKESTESYQLLIGTEYLSEGYSNSRDRNEFYEELTDLFASKIFELEFSSELKAFNGLRINMETGNHERIQKLEDELFNKFSKMICHKLVRSPTQYAIPAPRNPKDN